MDSTSPAHVGWQYWNNSQIPRHGSPKFLIWNRNKTEESLSDLLSSPQIIEQTINIMTDAMNEKISQCGCN